MVNDLLVWLCCRAYDHYGLRVLFVDHGRVCIVFVSRAFSLWFRCLLCSILLYYKSDLPLPILLTIHLHHSSTIQAEVVVQPVYAIAFGFEWNLTLRHACITSDRELCWLPIPISLILLGWSLLLLTLWQQIRILFIIADRNVACHVSELWRDHKM